MWFYHSYHLVGASPLPLDVGYLFFLVGSSILLSMVVQQRIVILESSQEKMSSDPSTSPSHLRTLATYLLMHRAEWLHSVYRRWARQAVSPCSGHPHCTWAHPGVAAPVSWVTPWLTWCRMAHSQCAGLLRPTWPLHQGLRKGGQAILLQHYLHRLFLA